MRELPSNDTIGDNSQSGTGGTFAATPEGCADPTFETMEAGIVHVSNHGHAEGDDPT